MVRAWAIVVGVAAVAAVGMSGSQATSAQTRFSACAVGTAAAQIAGRSVCLRDGAPGCVTRLDSRYHLYGFHCEQGVLRLDVSLMLSILRRRPLHVPSLPTGADCSKTASSGPLSQIVPRAAGPALGNGPAYPGLYYAPGEVGVEGAQFNHPNVSGPPDWGVGKVLWRVDPTYRGRVVLVRGRELAGSYEIRFQGGYPPPSELVVLAQNGLSTSSEEWFKEAGCYAFQLDGPGFSRLIVFEARRVD